MSPTVCVDLFCVGQSLVTILDHEWTVTSVKNQVQCLNKFGVCDHRFSKEPGSVDKISIFLRSSSALGANDPELPKLLREDSRAVLDNVHLHSSHVANELQLCEQNTLTRHIFSHLHALISMSHTTLAHEVCPHHVIHGSCAVVVLILFDSPFCTLHRLSHLPLHSPDLHLRIHLPCRLVREKFTVRFRE